LEGQRSAETAIEGASPVEEHFYGFGEKFDRLDQGGKTVHNLTFDEPGNKGDRSYKVAPWFVSTRGYGFHPGPRLKANCNTPEGSAKSPFECENVKTEFGDSTFTISPTGPGMPAAGQATQEGKHAGGLSDDP
jgi:hypothetical protein